MNKDSIRRLKASGLNTIQISFGENYPFDNLKKARLAKKAGINVCFSVTNTYLNKEYIWLAVIVAKLERYHVLYNLPSGELVKDFDKETYFKYRNHPLVREDNMFWAGKNKCPAGREKIYITAKGELMPCDRLHKVYSDLESMRKDFKDNKIWCTRLGDLNP